MEDKNQFTFIDENGKEVLCEILFAFESKEFNKEYVIFYPVNMEDFGLNEPQLMAGSVTIGEDNKANIENVTSEEEWQMLDEMVNKFFDEYEKEVGHSCGCGHDHDHDHEHHHHHDHDHDHECNCNHDDEEHDCNCEHKHCNHFEDESEEINEDN